MLHLTPHEKETILMMPEDEPFASISTYDDDLDAVLTRFSYDYPHLCQHLYHTEEGRNTYAVLRSCITMIFSPSGFVMPCAD